MSKGPKVTKPFMAHRFELTVCEHCGDHFDLDAYDERDNLKTIIVITFDQAALLAKYLIENAVVMPGDGKGH